MAQAQFLHGDGREDLVDRILPLDGRAQQVPLARQVPPGLPAWLVLLVLPEPPALLGLPGLPALLAPPAPLVQRAPQWRPG